MGNPEPLPWRRTLAMWPPECREHWGRLANRLEDEGLGWHDAERAAFERTKVEMEIP